MFARADITPPEVNGFGWNLGNSEYIVWSWTTLPTSGRPNFTKFAHKTCFRVRMHPFEKRLWKCAHKGSFSKTSNGTWSSSTTSDFRPRFLRNEYKSRKVMTGWHACGMLAFHPYRWNQLKVIPLACTSRTKSVRSNATFRLIYILKTFHQTNCKQI